MACWKQLFFPPIQPGTQPCVEAFLATKLLYRFFSKNLARPMGPFPRTLQLQLAIDSKNPSQELLKRALPKEPSCVDLFQDTCFASCFSKQLVTGSAAILVAQLFPQLLCFSFGECILCQSCFDFFNHFSVLKASVSCDLNYKMHVPTFMFALEV